MSRDYKQSTQALVTLMAQDTQGPSLMNVLWVLQSLERISDYIRNIAEQVVYLVQGKNRR